MPQQTYQMYDYHVWANDRLFTRLEQLPNEAFLSEVTSVFPSVAHTLGHMYLYEKLFRSVLAEIPNEDIFPKLPGWKEEAKVATVDEMRRLFAGLTESYRELLSRTPEPDKAMTISHPIYGRLDTRFSDILMHVVNHGTYHRGNATAILRQQGYAGVPTDYMFYLAERQGDPR
ncbi:DinB family protein [Cohnella sp. AR92]|uniref:DinB family protein n=1 Tax=Cohnella sp. AR92 TaxID=648716 RepID=UPI000F8CE4A3|nr:DinB family protein [Cohnella sp. AR92]RUS42454.1 damage-inducible protein DinB [Cohnella sp. AR92]